MQHGVEQGGEGAQNGIRAQDVDREWSRHGETGQRSGPGVSLVARRMILR